MNPETQKVPLKKLTRSAQNALGLLITVGILSVLLWGYSGYRAFSLSMTIDESSSFLNFVGMSYGDIFWTKVPSANNHVLNTLAMKFFSELFGVHAFWLRFGVLLSQGIYLVSSFLLMRALTTRPMFQLLGFCWLNFNPYLIDFFCVARGYGLALAFMSLSLYGLVRFLKAEDLKYQALSFFSAMLATLANFTYLYFFLSLLAITGLYWLLSGLSFSKEGGLRGLRLYLIPALSALLLGAYLWQRVIGLMDNNSLYFGGQNGFYQDTLSSLIQMSLFGQRYLGKGTGDIFQFAVLSLLAAGTLWSLLTLRTRNQKYLLGLVWGIMAIASLLQHELMGTRFLIERASLIFYPVGVLAIWLGVEGILKGKKLWLSLLLGLLCFASLYHVLRATMTDRVKEWWFEAHTKEMMYALRAEVPQGEKISLGADFQFISTINYYLLAEELDFAEELIFGRAVEEADQEYFFAHKVQAKLLPPEYKLYKQYQFNYLMKRSTHP